MTESKRNIKILIIDDSLIQTLLLKKILAFEPTMKVIGCVSHSKKAIQMTSLLKPDLITMGIQIPITNGLETIRQIMMHHPTPIVIITDKSQHEHLDATFKILEAGALSVLEKPVDVTSVSLNSKCTYMLDTIRSMSEIRVMKRSFTSPKPIKSHAINSYYPHANYELLALGASVGGPQALRIILTALPKNFPIPIVVVQHMTLGFISNFVNWLNEYTSLKIKEATHLENLMPGNVYFAPDHTHFTVERSEKNLLAKLVNSPPVAGFCPSVSVLLKSVASTCGENAIGILLTGMGNDGAQGLLSMKQAHAHTLIQDPQSAIVFGMAGVAEKLGAVDKIVPLNQIADYLIDIVHND